MADIKLGYGIGIKATLLTPAGAVCDLRDALYVNAVLTLPNGSTMYAQDIAVDRVTNAIYVRLLADRELTAVGNYRILFNVKLADGVMYSTVAVNFANVTTDADAEYKELSLSFSLEVTDYPQNVERTGASPKVSSRQTWLVYNDEAKAYEDTGIPAEVNLGDYYTKEETDAKGAELESKVGLDAYFAAGNVPSFSMDGDNLEIKLPGTELRIYDSKGNATIVDSYLSAQFTIANFQKLVLNLRTKEIETISFSEAVNSPYLTLLSLTSGAVSGLFDKYYQHNELSYINELEQLKNKVEIYVEPDYRDSVKLEGNISTGVVFFTYKGNLVIRSSKKNRNILITDLAAELGVSLVTSTKGVENCIAIPNISNLCFNALTGAFEIVHRDSVQQEHVILIAGASGVIIGVYPNLLNANDVKGICEDLAKELAKKETAKTQVNYIGERPNLPLRSKFNDLFSTSTSAFVLSTQGMDVYGNKYLFQGSNEPSESVNYNNIVVVEMDSKNIIGGFEYKKESHLNTINCGQKYAESDTYPLLYVSECYYEHKCEVVRLANDLASYQVIQKIAYNGSHFEGWSAYDWTIDLENSFIYAFGTNDGFTQILKFTLPSPTSGDVVLTDSDILDVIEFNGAYIYQGARVINNQMYIPFGFDTSEYPAFLKVIDLERKKVVSHIPLDGIGEPEAVALYKNNLLVVNHANKPTYTEIIL